MPRVGIALNVQPLIVSSGLYVMFSKTNCSGFSGGNASLNLTLTHLLSISSSVLSTV